LTIDAGDDVLDETSAELETLNSGMGLDSACTGYTMSSGDLIKANESILCYPSSYPRYKFGIDSTNTLAYYMYDTLVWRAVPTVEESTACIVFGNCIRPSMAFFRLQTGGSLAGYDADSTKIWDSHENIDDNGEYYLSSVGVSFLW
jgi:hypothetical protein